ncbi:hypothetical protein [Fodinicola acaciae]|uniref:hypothetical protein n=1 Tax=Fodinicola acaciae TaxID=2681555 RepID=UPI0013D55C3C|nr:hypothetical protein [Fodinicola acaciae]
MNARRFLHRCPQQPGGWMMIVTAPSVEAETGTHVQLDGLCADCGSAWPCERSDVSAYQFPMPVRLLEAV